GKVSGGAITSGTIGGAGSSVAINTTGTITAGAFSGNGSGLTNIPDSALNTISTAGKVSGGAITSGTIGGAGSSVAINTTGTITAGAFSGNGSGLTNVSDTTRVLKAGDTMTGTLSIDAGTADSALRIRTDSNTREALYISKTGKVGIGTTAPGAPLEVNHSGVADGAYILKIQGTAVDGGFKRKGNNLSFLAYESEISQFKVASGATQIKFVGTTDVEMMRITNGGYVGIGTTSPSRTLEVAGTVKATNFEGDGSGLTNVAPSGNAGGDLTGTYPSPTIGSGKITAAKMGTGSVTSDALAANAVTSTAIANNAVDLTTKVTGALPDSNLATITTAGKVSGGAINSGTIGGAGSSVAINTTGTITAGAFSGNGSALTNVAPSGNAGGDLTGTYPSPTIGSGKITASKMATGSITSDAIAANAVTATAIANSAVDLTTKVTGALPDSNLATITTAGKVSGGAITSGTIGGSTAINTTGTVTAAAFVGNGSGLTSVAPSGNAGGDLTGTYPSPTIGSGKITAAKMATGSVTNDAIAAGAIDASKLTTGAVTAGAIAANAVTSTAIASNAVDLTTKVTGSLPDSNLATITTAGKVSGGAITSGTIGGSTAINTTGTVTAAAFVGNGSGLTSVAPSGNAGGDLTGTYPSPTIGSGKITAAKMATGSITSDAIAANAVTATAIASNAVDLTTKVTGALPDSNLATITTAGKVSGSAITSGTIGGSTAINTTGTVTAGAFSGNGSGLTNVSDTTRVLKAGDTMTGTLSIDAGTSDSALRIRTDSNTREALYISKSGKVGIGTTNPLYALDVAGDGIGRFSSTVQASTLQAPLVYASTIGTYNYSNQATNIQSATGYGVNFKVGTSTVAVIDGTGNVGIGTTAPGQKLSVAGTIEMTAGSGGGLKFPDATIQTTAATPGNYVQKTGDTMTGLLTANAGINVTGTVTATAFSGNGSALTNVPPSGNAGGDLTGTYPNPTIGSGTVTGAKIANNTLTAANFGTGVVTSAAIAANAVTSTAIAANAVDLTTKVTGSLPDSNLATISTAGKVSGSAITSGTIGGSTAINTTGTVTAGAFVGNGSGLTNVAPSGNAGGDLTGTYPSPTIGSGKITAAKMATGSITSDALAANAVTSGAIANSAVDLTTKVTGALPDSNLATITTAGKVSGGAITSGTIGGAGSSVAINTTGTITAGAFSGNGSALTSVAPSGNAGGDLTGTYPNPTIGSGKIIGSNLASGINISTTGTITAGAFSGNGSALTNVAPSGNAGGDLTGTYPSPTIGSGKITAAKMGTGSVTSDALAANAVTSTAIANNAVDLTTKVTGALPDSNLATITTAGKVSGGAINSGTIGGAGSSVAINTTGTITAGAFSGNGAALTNVAPSGNAGGDLTGTYPSPTIGSGKITASKMATGSVTNDAIGAGAVDLTTKVTGALPDSNLATISTAGKVSGSAITSGTIGGNTAINTTGDLTANNAVVNGNLWVKGRATTVESTVATFAVQEIRHAPTLVALTIRPSAESQTLPGLSTIRAYRLAGDANPTFEVSSDGEVIARKFTGDGSTLTNVAPSGNAGGDLTGTYPSPTIGTGKITAAKMGTGSVTSDAIAANAVTATAIANNAVDLTTKVTGALPDSNLATITTAGKVSGGAINSGTIGGGGSSVAINTTGTITAGAFSGNGSGLTNIPDSALNTISTAGKVSGGAITSGTIGGAGSSVAINTTGTITAGAFSGNGSGLTNVSDTTKVLKAGDTMTGTLTIDAGTANTALRVRTDSNTREALYVSKAGYLGIGTTNPGALLEVSKYGAANQQAARFTNTGGNVFLELVAGTKAAQIWSQGAGQLAFYTGATPGTLGTQQLMIDENGNVGVGAASPGQKLSVAGTIETTVGGIKFPDTTIQTTAMSGGNYVLKAGDTMTGTLTNTAGANFATSSGSVGIGTAEPGAKLSVHLNEANTNTVPYINMYNDASGYVDWALKKTGSNDLTMYDAYQNLPVMTWQYVASGGKVGIGTTTPASKLTVAGTIETTVGGIKFPDTTIQTTAATPGNYVLKAGDTMTGTLTNTAGANFATSSGSVGIGTTGPATKLDVRVSGGDAIAFGGGAVQVGVLGFETSPAKTYLKANHTSYALGFRAGNSATDQITILTGGNVGIGTTEPGAKLDIYGGNLKLTGASQTVYAMPTSGYVTNLDLVAGQTFYGSNGASIRVQSSGAGADGTLLFSTNQGGIGASERMRITNTGNVSIGTTESRQKLSVAGTIETTAGGIKFPDTTIQTTAVSGANYVLKAGDTMTGLLTANAGINVTGTVTATAFSGDGSALSSVAPSGNAGGDLTGTYPSPTIGTGKITATKMGTGSVTSDAIAANAVTATAIANNAVDLTTKVTGALPDSNLATITTAGKVSGGAINSGTIGGGGSSVAINTTGIITAGAFSGNGSGLTNIPDSALNTISTAGKVSGGAITSGTIGGGGSSVAINTTGTITAGAFSGNGSGLTNVSDTTRVLKAGDTMTGMLSIDAGTADPALRIRTDSNTREALYIAKAGNVGIGTTAPSTKLDINGGRLRVSNDGEGVLEIKNSLATDNGTWNIGIGSGGQFSQGYFEIGVGAVPTVATYSLRLMSDGTAAARVGMTAPIFRSPITGVGDGSVLAWTNTGGNFNGYLSVGAIHTNDGNAESSTRLYMGDFVNSKVDVRDWNNNVYLTVQRTGNIGIGTTEPSSKLTVAGTIEMTSGSGGGVKFPDTTIQTTAATPGNYVLKAGDTMTGLLTANAGINVTGTVTATAFSGDGSALTNVPPFGNAGGDLTGTYPSPTIGVGKITAAKMGTGSITSDAIAANAVTATAIASNAVDLTTKVTGALPDSNLATITTAGKVSGGAITSGTIGGAGSSVAINTTGTITAGAFSGNGSALTNVAPSGNAGGDLTGTYPSPTIGSGKITAAKMATGSVTSDAIAAGAVDLTTKVTGALPDSNLATITTAGKVSGGAINSGTIGGGGSSVAINTTGIITAGAFSGNGSGLTNVSDTTKVLKAGDTMTGTMSIDAGTADSALRIRTDSNTREALYVSKAGNVGIGTTGPGAKLETSGEIRASRPTIETSQYLSLLADSLGNRIVGTTLDGYQKPILFNMDVPNGNANSSNYYAFQIDGSEKVRIDSTGNVGIGTTAPGQKLSVAGTIETTTGGVKFPDTTIQTTAATPANYVQKAGDTMTGTLTSSATTALKSSSGNTLTLTSGQTDGASAVGHVLDTPSYTTSGAKLLSVRNNGVEKASVGYDGSVYGAAIVAPIIYAATLGTYNYSNQATNIQSQTGYGVNFKVGTSTVAVIDGTGSVSIGTTESRQKLSVVGTIETTAGGIKFPDTTIQTTAATPGNYVLKAGDTMTGTLTNTAGANFATSSGSVGIGTANPSAKLDVNGGGITATGNIYSSGGRLQGGNSLMNASNGFATFGSNSPSTPVRINLDAVGTGSGGITLSTVESNVGIGITTPSSKLTVAGTIETTAGGVKFPDTTIQTTAATPANYVQKAGDTMTGTLTNSAATAINAIGNAYLATTAGNKVGIGTATPYKELTVSLVKTDAATVVDEVSDYSGAMILQSSVSSANGDKIPLVFSVGGASPHISSVIEAGREASNWNTYLAFYTNNITSGPQGVDAIQEKMRINSSGSVGIGTTEPGSKLEVSDGNDGAGGVITAKDGGAILMANDSVAYPLQIGNNTGGANSVRFRVNTNGAIDYAGSSSATPTISLPSNKYLALSGGNGMTIAGNVGIGTTAPTSPLTVAGTIETTVGGVKFPDTTIQTTAATPANYVLKAGDTMTGTMSIDAGTADPALRIRTDSNTREALYISKAGNVGIGTTAPGVKLTMPYNSYIGWQYSSANNTVTHKIGKTSDGAGPLLFETAFNPGDAGKVYTFSSQAGEKLTILHGGNVGIGSTNPSSPLTVAGTIETTAGGIKFPDATIQTTAMSGSNYVLKAGDTMTGTMSIDAGTADPALRIRTDSNTREALYISKAGNVGIGTTAPGSKLETSVADTSTTFAGNATQVGLALTNTNTTANNWSTLLFSDDGGTPATMIGTQYTDHTNNYGELAFGTRGASGFAERVRINSSGNVGIGTTAPGQKLSVAG
ncbi:MAG: hypothetical protein WC632_07385, partial [Candidatus Margulisiibacteriota bacterium]